VSVLGNTSPFPLGDLLGTGYETFESPTGIHGMSKQNKIGRLDLLAVAATKRGTGQFRDFIDQAKKEYKTICVWEIWNEELAVILARYGFRPVEEIDHDTGELLTGLCWNAGKKRRRR